MYIDLVFADLVYRTCNAAPQLRGGTNTLGSIITIVHLYSARRMSSDALIQYLANVATLRVSTHCL